MEDQRVIAGRSGSHETLWVPGLSAELQRGQSLVGRGATDRAVLDHQEHAAWRDRTRRCPQHMVTREADG